MGIFSITNFISYEISKLITILTSPWNQGQIGIKPYTKHVIYQKVLSFP